MCVGGVSAHSPLMGSFSQTYCWLLKVGSKVPGGRIHKLHFKKINGGGRLHT